MLYPFENDISSVERRIVIPNFFVLPRLFSNRIAIIPLSLNQLIKQMSTSEPSTTPPKPPEDEEDDAYTLAIKRTGCFQENETLQLCYYDSGRDWRACRKELERFRECMKQWTKSQQERLAKEA